jgi:hypothetical protein
MNIMGMFAHVDALPFIYGIFIAINLTILVLKIKNFKIFSAAVDIAVFWGIFQMHGGTMTGSLAALIAATVSSLIFPLIFRRKAVAVKA